MFVFNNTERITLERFCRVKQHSLKRAMKKYLENHYGKKNIISNDKYIIALGDIKIGLVAHMDTAFKQPPMNIYYDSDKTVMWSPEGLGADDRAGIYAIYKIVEMGYKPTIILTTDEEIGGIGATALAASHKHAPTSLKYLIELDRQGEKDCVFYYCENKDFQNYVETFGFVTAFGTYTDICEICPKWGVAGVNLSVGYVNEHRTIETLNTTHLISTINKVTQMLEDEKNSEYFKYIAGNKLLHDTGYDPIYGVSPETWLSWVSPQGCCESCGKPENEDDLFKVYNNIVDEECEVCADCLTSIINLDWCDCCKKPYVYDENEKTLRNLCNKCLEEEKNLVR